MNFLDRLPNNPQIYFVGTRPVVAELFHADGQISTKLRVALRSAANAPKKFNPAPRNVSLYPWLLKICQRHNGTVLGRRKHRRYGCRRKKEQSAPFVNGDLRFQSVIARCQVKISDGTPTIVANDFRVLPESFQAAVRIPPQITPRPFPSNIDFQVTTHLPTCHMPSR